MVQWRSNNPRTSLMVRDLSGRSRGPRLEVRSGCVYELICSITVAAEPQEWASPDLGHTWFDDYRTRIPVELSARLRKVGGGELKFCAHLAGLLADADDADDVDGFIDRVAALPAAALDRLLLGGCLHGTVGATERRALEDVVAAPPAKRRRLVESLPCDDDRGRTALRALATADPSATQRELVDLLRRWREVVREHLDAAGPLLRQHADHLRRAVSGLPLVQAIERGTNGIHYEPEPGIGVVHIIPQLAMRPWVCVDEQDDTKRFLVGVSEEALAGEDDTPPPRLLAICKALSDPQRLRILRRLSAGPAPLMTLAEHVGSAKSTAHHHLVVLRDAGLVTAYLEPDNQYRLRAELAEEVAVLLEAYLEAPRPSLAARVAARRRPA